MKESKTIDKFDETILQILLDKPLTYTELKEKLKTTDPTLSKHLKDLEEMFLITKIKEKRYSLTDSGKETTEKISIKRRIKGMVISYFIKELNPIISLLDYLDFPLFFKQKCFIKKFPIFNLLRYYITLLYIEPIIKEYNNAEEYIKDVKDFWKIIKDKEYYIASVKFSWKKAIKNVLNDIEFEKERSKEIKKEALEYIEKIIKENKERIFEDFNGYSKNENKWCLSIDIKHSHKIKLSILNGTFFFIIKFAILYFILLFLISDISYLNAILNIFNLSLFIIASILFLIEMEYHSF